ncbi:MAG: hypothetical protein U0990_02020 [Candidatus Nanopelagicales bacterium]|nr:hypothetical protein [Candidatus Nanopelagicales bacterium]MDZ4248846.1 hypothetical protein [Candidatus Nanopelagicales bacterium]MDZ7578379.1 hypothetical protein [Candidatus Nanopelagicales bacterium]
MASQPGEHEDFEAPSADVKEQSQDVVDEHDAEASADWEANPADTKEQSRAVPMADDEYR